jgi:hypothetical protein
VGRLPATRSKRGFDLFDSLADSWHGLPIAWFEPVFAALIRRKSIRTIKNRVIQKNQVCKKELEEQKDAKDPMPDVFTFTCT